MGIQGTADDWGKDLLADADNFFGDSEIGYIWLTARDANICALCAVRKASAANPKMRTIDAGVVLWSTNPATEKRTFK